MPGCVSRSVAMAIPPLRTTASAMADPMPPAAPVMRMTLLRKRPMRTPGKSRVSVKNVSRHDDGRDHDDDGDHPAHDRVGGHDHGPAHDARRPRPPDRTALQ